MALRWLSLCIEKSRFVDPGIDFILHSAARTANQSSCEQKFSAEINKKRRLEGAPNNDKHLQSGFACAHSSVGTQKALNVNSSITEELSKLATAYKNSNDQWRCFGYEKAIAAIKRYPRAITSREGKKSR